MVKPVLNQSWEILKSSDLSHGNRKLPGPKFNDLIGSSFTFNSFGHCSVIIECPVVWMTLYQEVICITWHNVYIHKIHYIFQQGWIIWILHNPQSSFREWSVNMAQTPDPFVFPHVWIPCIHYTWSSVFPSVACLVYTCILYMENPGGLFLHCTESKGLTMIVFTSPNPRDPTWQQAGLVCWNPGLVKCHIRFRYNGFLCRYH